MYEKTVREVQLHPDPNFVADIFDTVVSDDGWARSASVVAAALGVDQAAIVVNRSSALPDVSVTPDIIEFIGRYEVRYQGLDPWAERRRLIRPRGAVLANELFPEEQLVKTEFYNDYARQIGMFRPMTTDVITPAGHEVEIGAEQPFSRTHFGETDKARLDAITPYVARAVDVRQALRVSEAQRSLGASLVDALLLPTIVCDQTGRISLSNEGAEDLARCGFLSRKNGVLRLPLQSAGLAVQAQRMIASAASGGPGGTFHVRDADDTLYMVIISPVPPSFDHGPAFALITVSRSIDRAFDPEMLRLLFNLSPAQLDLAIGLYDGLSIEEYAVKRNVKVSTLRTQLAQLFERMGVNSQKDIVGLIGRLPHVRS